MSESQFNKMQENGRQKAPFRSSVIGAGNLQGRNIKRGTQPETRGGLPQGAIETVLKENDFRSF